MNARELREEFHRRKCVYEGALLTFSGMNGYDVYNCSIPFEWQGKRYLFGRVERREDFANSVTFLLMETGKDHYVPVEGAVVYPIEDPHVAMIRDEIILGGTHVRKRRNQIDTLYGYYYRGRDLRFLSHFTCGPANMKDIRLVELSDGRVGVFTRPRGKRIAELYGSEAVVGFAILNSIDELDDTIVDKARVIDGLFSEGEWGGCNQCYLLKDGRIGVIGHRCYKQPTPQVVLQVYVNISFIFDPATFSVSDMQVIGDKDSYPPTPHMLPYLADCAFTSGIEMRPDGKADLYSGLGDVTQGRIVIDSPFGDLLK
ncbi:MAG: DUF1861 family protein [Clostridia bacterium]|nr:DUF1861 family protein [Clostridia bacterium]